MQTDCKSGTQKKKKDFKDFMETVKSDFRELLKSYKAIEKYTEISPVNNRKQKIHKDDSVIGSSDENDFSIKGLIEALEG